ncbi:hypothetical protein F7O00_05175 [Campylobacter coli]|nr:hypothetical protein [Campylobacter coli]
MSLNTINTPANINAWMSNNSMYNSPYYNNYVGNMQQQNWIGNNPFNTNMVTSTNTNNDLNSLNFRRVLNDPSYADYANNNLANNPDSNFWASFDKWAGRGKSALDIVGTGANIFTGIGNYNRQKAYNKKAMANLDLQNEALRFELNNRKQELARLNQIRSNVNKQMTSGSQVKTSY